MNLTSAAWALGLIFITGSEASLCDDLGAAGEGQPGQMTINFTLVIIAGRGSNTCNSKLLIAILTTITTIVTLLRLTITTSRAACHNHNMVYPMPHNPSCVKRKLSNVIKLQFAYLPQFLRPAEAQASGIFGYAAFNHFVGR